MPHPYVSPLFGDLTGFLPTFLQSGTRGLFLGCVTRGLEIRLGRNR